MSDEKVPATEAPAYESPAIEQVITRDGFEREVQYAGLAFPSDS